MFVRVNNTQTTHAGKVYNRDYVIDYTSYERNDLAVDSPNYMAQKHVYTACGERLEQFTERGNWDRLLYVHEDVMGNTMHYTKATGQSFGELRYDVWGAPTLSGKLQNNDNGNFVAATFTGHIYDTVLDIYFAEARFYDAKNRQWMSSDPIKDGLNWYQYCGSNPTTYVDYNGLSISKPFSNGVDKSEFPNTTISEPTGTIRPLSPDQDVNNFYAYQNQLSYDLDNEENDEKPEYINGTPVNYDYAYTTTIEYFGESYKGYIRDGEVYLPDSEQWLFLQQVELMGLLSNTQKYNNTSVSEILAKANKIQRDKSKPYDPSKPLPNIDEKYLNAIEQMGLEGQPGITTSIYFSTLFCTTKNPIYRFVSGVKEGAVKVTDYYFKELAKDEWLDLVSWEYNKLMKLTEFISVLSSVSGKPNINGKNINIQAYGDYAQLANGFGTFLLPKKIRHMEEVLKDYKTQDRVLLPYKVSGHDASFDKHGNLNIFDLILYEYEYGVRN